MGEFSIWHWMVVLLVVLLLFGGGKITGLMGDLANGIKAFKKNMADEPEIAKDADADRQSGSISGPAGEAAPQMTQRESTAARETTAAH
jgi:sec-independent protein translocase protein TatA